MPQDSIVARFVGDNHVATCNTSDGSKPRWYVGRPGEAKASIRGGTGGSPVQDAVWRGSGNGLQIVISNIGKKDRGEYCCRLSDVKRASEKCFELTVKEPIEFLDTPTEQVATEGLPYVIKCEVTGDPTPEIQWKVRGQLWKGVQGGRFDQIADGLSITRVSVSDQGFYECAAIQMSEQVTGQQTRNISLRVRHKPTFLAATTSSPVYGYLTGEVNLTCAVTADPPATISWYPERDRQQMVEPLASRVINEENRSTLRVKLSNITVFGKYTCIARNQLGNVTRIIQLQQGLKPNPPRVVVLTSASATTAQLDVSSPVVGPKVQHSTQKSGSNTGGSSSAGGASSSGGNSSSKSNGANDTLGYRVRLTRITNGTSYSFEQECEPAPCRLYNLTPGSNYTMRIATKGRAGLSDWVNGPMFQTAMGAASALAPNLVAVALLLVAALAGTPLGAARS
ncbi:neural cell adhesion molecule 2-like isoform X2 [Frankliniella occidentalis]|nr:neural cell adhesion molecule 2-like isoform X2 [Frankliniella occidentalis]